MTKKVIMMKCYLGGDCIHTVEMIRYIYPDGYQNVDTEKIKIPFNARRYCMQINCSVYEKVCLLADEYRTFRATQSS